MVRSAGALAAETEVAKPDQEKRLAPKGKVLSLSPRPGQAVEEQELTEQELVSVLQFFLM